MDPIGKDAFIVNHFKWFLYVENGYWIGLSNMSISFCGISVSQPDKPAMRYAHRTITYPFMYQILL